MTTPSDVIDGPKSAAGTPAPPGSRLEDDSAAAHRMGAAVGSPYSELSTFRRGQVLQDRFKVLRFIARGGAGEVYEAHDMELRCPVALKVARPEICDNSNAIERFRREIALARQVTHPNVCRIFDVFKQDIPPTSPNGKVRTTLFLTMELLNGESVASRLHRLGPMEPDEALPLIEGMVAGLTAAHRVGVIHRDFKSANVVLVEELDGTRAVITDFGLAHGHIPDPGAEDITVTGTVVGTPNYMSPEQLTGGAITPAVDMYALGIVVYEMVTGHRPFVGETDLSTAVKRLTEAPASPRLHVPELDPSWERAILRCLERDPEDRFPTLSEIPRALTGQVATPTAPSVLRAKRKRWAWVAAIAAPIVLVLALLLALLSGSEMTPFGFGEVAAPRIALLEPRNLSQNPSGEYIAGAFTEMLAADLEAGDKVRLVPQETVRTAFDELALPTTGSLGRETVQRIRRALETDILIEGSYLLQPSGELRVQLRAHDAAGATVTLTEDGHRDELIDIVTAVTVRLQSRLGLAERREIVDAPETETQTRSTSGAERSPLRLKDPVAASDPTVDIEQPAPAPQGESPTG